MPAGRPRKPSTSPEQDPVSDPTTNHVQRAVAGDAATLDWIVRHFSPLLLAQARYRNSRRLQATHDPEHLLGTSDLKLRYHRALNRPRTCLHGDLVDAMEDTE